MHAAVRALLHHAGISSVTNVIKSYEVSTKPVWAVTARLPDLQLGQ